jgi:ABC-type dipeptide/oligopeptide/nickel transport system permease component
MDNPIMPVIVLSVTISSMLGVYDIYFNDSFWIQYLKNINRFLITVPGYFLIFVFYVYYKKNLPTRQELNGTKGMWTGVIICILSVLLFLAVSIIKK